MLLSIERFFDRVGDIVGHFTAIVMLVMMLNVFYNVVMRYFFDMGSIGMQELEWHFFSIIMLLGIAYTLKEDGHVRVDIVHDRLSDKKRATINIAGVIIFLMPFAMLIGFGSIPFVNEAFQSGEISGDPGGLTHRWIVKALIPCSMALLAFAAIGFIVKNINLYRGAHKKLKEGLI